MNREDLTAAAGILRTLLGAVEAQLGETPAAPAPNPDGPLVLPKLIMPAVVNVDPSASVVHVEIALSQPPTTTAIIPVMSINGDHPNAAWEGGQFQRFNRLVVFPAGGPARQSVAIPITAKAEDAGRSFGLYTPNEANVGLALGGGRTQIVFTPGAVNTPSPAMLVPPRKPNRATLAYEFNPTTFKASDAGGVDVVRSRFSFGRDQVGNKEVGYYVDPVLHPGTHPFEVKNGVLIMRAEKLALPKEWEGKSWDYTAVVLEWAWLSQLYGTYEVEAQSTLARGSWPAFWLLPADGSWPPELDVFEHPRNGEIGAAHTTGAQHWGTADAHQSIGASIDLAALWGRPVDLASGFHTYTLDWRADLTSWFVDGQEVFTTPTRFHKPAFPLLDVAVGGWAGPPSGWTSAEMQVRALRVFK